MSSDGPRRRQIEDTTAARLAEIVAAAERAAQQVIDEAEAEARERLTDANEEADRIVAERLGRLAVLTEELDAQAESLKRGAEALRVALAEVRSEMGGAESFGGSASMRRPEPAAATEPEDERPKGPSLTVVGGVAPAPVAPAPVAPQPDEPDQPEPEEAPGEPEALGTAAGARLLATQMAVSGSSREEIEARLHSGFALADTTAILDAILGPEL
jgi:vacuolar-type H+-ATPase subunit H